MNNSLLFLNIQVEFSLHNFFCERFIRFRSRGLLFRCWMNKSCRLWLFVNRNRLIFFFDFYFFLHFWPAQSAGWFDEQLLCWGSAADAPPSPFLSNFPAKKKKKGENLDKLLSIFCSICYAAVLNWTTTTTTTINSFPLLLQTVLPGHDDMRFQGFYKNNCNKTAFRMNALNTNVFYFRMFSNENGCTWQCNYLVIILFFKSSRGIQGIIIWIYYILTYFGEFLYWSCFCSVKDGCYFLF